MGEPFARVEVNNGTHVLWCGDNPVLPATGPGQEVVLARICEFINAAHGKAVDAAVRNVHVIIDSCKVNAIEDEIKEAVDAVRAEERARVWACAIDIAKQHERDAGADLQENRAARKREAECIGAALRASQISEGIRQRVTK